MARKIKTITLFHQDLQAAEGIEDVICLANLIMAEILPCDATSVDSLFYYEETIGEDCNNCPLVEKCLACRINE